MEFLPVVKAGVLNGWIFMLFPLLHPLVMMLIVKDVMKKMQVSGLSKGENMVSTINNTVLFFGLFIFSVFLPLKLGTVWFYTGLVLCIVGIVLWIVAMINISRIPLDEPWTRGLYRYSRHPMVLSCFLVFVGAGIATASWIFLLVTVLFIILSVLSANSEERHCLRKFTDSYRSYMNRTPKWMGIPKS